MPRFEHFSHGFNDRNVSAFQYFVAGTHGQDMGDEPEDHDYSERRGHQQESGKRGGGEDTGDYHNTLAEIQGLGLTDKAFRKQLKDYAKKYPNTMRMERSKKGIKVYIKGDGIVMLHPSGEPRTQKNNARGLERGLRRGGHITDDD